MTQLIPTGKTRLLLVEGPDDKVFFCELRRHLGFDDSTSTIIEYGGKYGLAERLYQLTLLPEFTSVSSIGIVRDADYNETESQRNRGAPLRALDGVNTAIRNAYSQSSREMEPPAIADFMTASGSRPSYSLLVLPSSEASTEGFLETTLLNALAKDPLMRCVHEFFACVKKIHPESEVARNREDKQRLSVLLSGKLILRDLARSEDAKRELPRYMYKMKWWDDETFDPPAFDDAKDFLRQLLTN